MERTEEQVITYGLNPAEIKQAIFDYVNNHKAVGGTMGIIADDVRIKWRYDGKEPLGLIVINTYPQRKLKGKVKDDD